MFLRSLTLRGFKSFADRTTLEFTPGISVIVGPNGSGKSNLVDAIAWVLGEQGPRSLRGGQMTDVIFAGTPSRPPLGMAEVRMVIDNGAGLIPVPASEIEISRVVYRSGDSEYRLGGRPCRLLDIQELLSDTGIGRSLHTVIAQGQLDGVLQARPEERRQFVEEAAGIAKHRRRRERAERKLAGLEQDLLRLQDLVGELRRQLRPLTQQAELARRHEDLTREVAELRRRLAAARLRDLYRERDRRGPGWREAEARRDRARAELARLDAQTQRLEEERARAEEERARAEAHQAEAAAEKSAAEARLREAIRREAAVRERLAAASNRSGRLFALEEELERTRRARSEVAGALERRERDLEEAEREFRAAAARRAEAEGERRRAEERAAARRAEAEALARTIAGHEAELERLALACREVEGRLAAAEVRIEELRRESERLDEVSTPLADRQSALERERSELLGRLAALQAEQQRVLARREAVEARREELAETPGEALLRRRGQRAVGLLRDLIEAPADLRAAVRAALGPFWDAAVFAHREEALAVAGSEPTGGLVLAVEEGPEVALPALHGERSLYRLLRPDPRVRRLVGRLLGEVYLAADLADAAARHALHPHARFVTPAGHVVGPAVVQTPAGPDGRLEEVRRQAASLDRELAALRREDRETRGRLEEVERQLSETTARLEEADWAISAAAEEMAALEAGRAAARSEHRLLGERAAAVEAALQTARSQLRSIPAEDPGPAPLPPIPEPPVALRAEVEALRRERARLEAGEARAARELEALRSEDSDRLRDELASAEAARAEAEAALRDAADRLEAASAADRAAAEEARRVGERHAEAHRAWREAAAEVERIRAAHQDEDRERHDLERRIAEAERLLREGHGVDPGRAVAEVGEEESTEELARQADLQARRLTLLGKVNLRATGELEELKQRHDFLVRELEDVKAARRDLQRVIEQVDRRVADLFSRAFADVAREFSELFGVMFPGGEGRLVLTDPADPLGSGIEVEARPGRGRVRRLSLLSGGERALAALAFLFAIFRARPSPFYLMDEVEAALDDVNLHRFLEMVKAFARDSQVLIVTHQQRTMEVADALYGVSMGRDGASRVICQRLAEVAAG